MATQIETLFQQFLKERKYLHNVSPQTIEWYETAWKYFNRSATPCLTTGMSLTRESLEQFVYGLRDRGVRPVTCNTWLRALNAFCRWLHERGDLPARVHLKPLKAEKRLIATLEMQAISAIVSFKPPTAATVNLKHVDGPRKGQKAFALWRIHALVCTLLDTGCRVQELLDAKVEDFDFEDLLLTVIGKGDKQRRIPFSIDLRRILFRYRDGRSRFGVLRTEPLMFPVHEAVRGTNAMRFEPSIYCKSVSVWRRSVFIACATRSQPSICVSTNSKLLVAASSTANLCRLSLASSRDV